MKKYSESWIKQQNILENIKYLESLKDNPNIYLSYIGGKKDESGDNPKFGINPKSKYNTPLGIYTYPLREYWEKIKRRFDNVPFQGDKPYIAILEKKEDANFINDMYSDYGSDKYDEDLKKLKEYFINNVMSEFTFNKIKTEALETSKEKNPIMSMWNLVRLLSEYLAIGKNKKHKYNKEEEEKLNLNGLYFNKILRGVLGYDGFGDKAGKGYIHESEPTQTVFLNPRSFKLLKIIDNNAKKYIPDFYYELDKLDEDTLKEKIIINLEDPKDYEQYKKDFIKDKKMNEILNSKEILLARKKNWINWLGEQHPEDYEEKIKNDPNRQDLENDPDILLARKQGWIYALKTYPRNYEYYIKPHSERQDLANDSDILLARKQGWINWVEENFYQYEKEIKNDPKLQDLVNDSDILLARKQGWINHLEIEENYYFYEKHIKNDPERQDLANDPDILKVRKQGWIYKIKEYPQVYEEEIKSDPERQDLVNDPDILDAAGIKKEIASIFDNNYKYSKGIILLK